MRLVNWTVHRSRSMLLVFVVLMVVTGWFYAVTPTGFMPEEDQGYAMIVVQLPDAASLARTQEVMRKVDAILAATPGIAHRINIGGVSILDGFASLSNSGVIFAIYDDFEKRVKEGLSQELIVGTLYQKLSTLQEAVVFPLVPPAIQGLGVASGFEMELQLKGTGFDFQKLAQMTNEIIRDGNAQSDLRHLNTSYRAGVPQLQADIDRVKAESLNVSVGEVFTTFQNYLGSYYVNQFNKFGRTYQVYVQADSRYRLDATDINYLYTRNTQGKMVPVRTLTNLSITTGPALITLYNLYPAAYISGRAAPGFSSGQALSLMEQMTAQKLPPDMDIAWTGMSYQEKLVGNQALFVFALSVLLVFLVLAAQYESWSSPAAVILVVPLALLGTVLALSLRGYDNNIYTQIGMVLLIALASKNAILIVEVAREQRAKGVDLFEAAVDASRRRFRPILMTSFAFILGVLPLAVATGAGAAQRRALGTAVVGGMLASTLLAVLFVPIFYVNMQHFSEWLAARKQTPGKSDGEPKV